MDILVWGLLGLVSVLDAAGMVSLLIGQVLAWPFAAFARLCFAAAGRLTFGKLLT